MKRRKNALSLAAGIERFLKPMLGENGARRLILVYCSNQNKAPKDLSEEDLVKLGVFLKEHMQIFVGKEQAQQVLKQFGAVQ
jgi:hypothetical protein